MLNRTNFTCPKWSKHRSSTVSLPLFILFFVSFVSFRFCIRIDVFAGMCRRKKEAREREREREKEIEIEIEIDR